MKRKRWIAMSLACAMIAGALPAANVAAEESEYSNHLDISLAYWDVESNLTATADDKVLQTIEDKFNVTFVPQNISWDDYEQKLQLWAASGSLPDLFMGAERTKSTFATWAAQGLLTEIPSDLSDYPYLEDYMDSTELQTCQVDGKTYCIFRQTYYDQAETVQDRVIAYRWDLAQEAGITEEPETWEEFREMMLAIIEADPEGKSVQGLTAKGYSLLAGEFFPYSSMLAANDGVTFYWVDNGDGTYVPAYFAGDELGADMLPTFQLLRDMYTEGSIEKDIAVTTSTQALEKFLQGSNAAILIDGSATNIYNDVGQYWEEIYGNDFFDDVKFLTVMQDVNGELAYPVFDYAWSESYISSAVDEEKLDRILAIYDYLCSPEGELLAKCGIEGETYGYDEDGNITYEGYGTGNPDDTYKSIDVFQYLVYWTPEDDEVYPRTYPDEYYEVNEGLVELASTVTVPEYNYDCTSAYLSMNGDVSLTVADDMLTIMTGTDDVESMWNDIIAGYQADGLDDVIEQVNAAVK